MVSNTRQSVLRKLVCWSGIMMVVLFSLRSNAQESTTILMIHKLPVVKGNINGKEAYFILDTGASVTLLNNALADEFGFVVVQNEYWENYVVTGLGGKHLIQEARNVIVELGGHKLAFINKSCSLQRISKNFASDHIKIAGIIGSDVMGFLGTQINFATNSVVFYQKPIQGICNEKPQLTQILPPESFGW